MSPFLQLTLSLVVILIAAKAAGYLSVRLGQPSVLGELLVGLMLGPTLIDLTHLPFISDSHLGEVIAQLGDLGVLLLMFIAGLELHLSELARDTRISALAGVFGSLLSLSAGWAVSRAFGFENTPALFLGLAIAATSVSISAQTLMEMKVLRSRVGLGILGAAVFDDILAIFLLSAFLAISAGGNGLGSIAWIIARMLIFLILSAGFGFVALPRLLHQVAALPISQGPLTLAIVVMLVYGLAAELIGSMAAITGAFLAGLMFARTPEKKIFEAGVLSLGYSLMIPVFFVAIGLNINLRALPLNALWLLLAAAGAAMLAKFTGAGLGSRLGGFTWREAGQLGAGMVPRGEVSLVVSAVGLRLALMTATEFSVVVGVVVISTLVTPPLLHTLFHRSAAPRSPDLVTIEEPGVSREKEVR
ncbi:MAG: cation:proton antiporter [Chloroflexi bacterium]|nr:cation:proton antiporter [Chloroflexota bacterium]